MKKFNFLDDFFFTSFVALCIWLACSIFTVLVWGAARGSGTYSTSCIGSPCQKLYFPVTQEEKGWLTDTSTNSINFNNVLISSAINRLEVLGGNTNYILLQTTLQSGATFFVSSASVDGQTILARSSGNVGISSSTPTGIFTVDSSTRGLIYNTCGTVGCLGLGVIPGLTAGDTGPKLDISLDATDTISTNSATVNILTGGNITNNTAANQRSIGLRVVHNLGGTSGTQNTSSVGIYSESRGGNNNYPLLTQGGNVGINTLLPLQALEVIGSISASVNVGASTSSPVNTLGVAGGGFFTSSVTASTLAIGTSTLANVSRILAFDAAGGTASTHTALLKIVSDGITTNNTANGQINAGISILVDGNSAGGNTTFNTAIRLKALSADDAYAIITEAGKVKISGQNSPATGGALCLNGSNVMSKCTSGVDASGNCTCP